MVLVGAMRPATAISADGPINLLAAVTLAGSESAIGRGPMIVLNDRIQSAYYTTKTNANMLDTFKAVEQGNLGYFDDIKPKFYYTPATPLGKTYFDVTTTSVLPQVDIVYGYQGLPPSTVPSVVENGAKGIVLAGMGAGGWTNPGAETVNEALENGTFVVYSHRSQDGIVAAEGSDTKAIGSGILNPQKSRVLLQLCINSGFSMETAKSMFEFAG